MIAATCINCCNQLFITLLRTEITQMLHFRHLFLLEVCSRLKQDNAVIWSSNQSIKEDKKILEEIWIVQCARVAYCWSFVLRV